MKNNLEICKKLFILILLTVISSLPLKSQVKVNDGKNVIISTNPFFDSVHHWYDIHDDGNIVNPIANQPRYKETEIIRIADNILLYQRDNGGWPKNYDMQAILTREQVDSLLKTKNKFHTTFDNSTTYTHIEYLAQVYTLKKTEKYKEACLKGINFILSAQYPNGGWPQYFPLENNYSRRITFNDGAFIGIMELLKKIVDNDPNFSFVGEKTRKEASLAFKKGLECILNCQIVGNGRPTAWCQQYDEISLKPAWARAFEPPSICNGESVPVVLFLMSLDHPHQRVIEAVRSAVKWFSDSRIYNTRVNTVPAPPERSQWMTSTTDRVVVIDSLAPPIWTRFYELGTEKPLFCDRNSKFLYSLAEVSRERRSGYSWYTYAPQIVLDKYAEWQKKLSDDLFLNPVLGGDYPDPSVLRVGNDFYMTHSSFNYYPGLLVWHSTDLIHWERVSHALSQYVGSVWAPDLIKYKDTYYIYFPAGGTNWVVTAKSPKGPWTAPVDLKLKGFIDPGHVISPDGNRYLYLSKGSIIQLAEDGLSTIGEPKYIYGGWEFPKSWSTECFCLESPKSTVKDGYYYLTVAEGGTAGPATSHMVVSARAKSPYGPWENSPYNPVVHTGNRTERWWSQGHGTLVDDIEGNWWIMYHGYEKNFHTLGRETLMLPVEWTGDKWFHIPEGVKSSDQIRKPFGIKSMNGTELSDDFSGNSLGLQWQFYKRYSPERVGLNEGKLILKAEGNSFDESSPLLVNSGDHRYEIITEFNIDNNVTAGLCLYYNETANVRISVDTARFTVFIQKNAKIREKNSLGNHGFLRILNDENEVSFYFSADGKEWTRVERSLDATGYNHNVFGEFLSLRAGLFAFGNGKAVFDNFIYKKL
ncbi:MAG: pectate lyase [Bacteroidia bacterium]|nr:pectate lyase [Bacteroidia bacterium]